MEKKGLVIGHAYTLVIFFSKFRYKFIDNLLKWLKSVILGAKNNGTEEHRKKMSNFGKKYHNKKKKSLVTNREMMEYFLCYGKIFFKFLG